MKSKLLPLVTKLLITFLSGMAGLGASAQNFSWAQHWGNTSQDEAFDIDVDPEGNSYVTGVFGGTVDFDPGPATLTLTSTSTRAFFVGKYNPQGSPIWVRAFQQIGVVRRSSLIVDKDKNVYTTGTFHGTIDFAPGPGAANLNSYPGHWQSFVCKLDSTGSVVWAKRLGKDTAYSTVEAFDIGLDANLNVFTTGHFRGNVDFDPGQASHNMFGGKSEDGFVCKLDASGNFVWAKQFGGDEVLIYSRAECYSLALDADGSVYTTGSFYYGADFDPGPGTFLLPGYGTPNEQEDIFVSKLDNNGNHVWAKSFGSGDWYEQGMAIAVDAQKNVYTVGEFKPGADLDPGTGVYTLPTFTGSGIVQTYISKLDAVGDFVWARSMNDSHSAISHSPRDMYMDAYGDIYVSGTFSGTVDFNTAPASSVLSSAGTTDGFAGKWDPSGNLVWIKSYGGSAAIASPRGIAVDGQKNVYTAGVFSQTVDFNPDAGVWNLSSAGGGDAFLLKLSECQPIHGAQAITHCRTSYQWPQNGQTYTASGTYWGVGQSVGGCDSVLVLDLTLAPIIGAPLSISVCKATYTWPLNNITYTATGVYKDTIQIGGCDSIVTLNLQINPLVQAEYIEACQSYTWALTGETYTFSGTYNDTVPSGSCDLVHKLELVIGDPAFSNAIQAFGDELVCTQPDGDLYEWVDCNNGNAILQTGADPYFYPWNPGSYAVTVYMDGCMNTSACYGFLVDLGVTESESDFFKIFPNPVLDRFQIQATGAAEIQRVVVADLNGREIYAASVTGNAVTVPALDWKPGIYFVRVISKNSQHVYKICKL